MWIADENRRRVMISQEQVEDVDNFHYLGGLLTNHVEVEIDVISKIGKVSACSIWAIAENLALQEYQNQNKSGAI